MSEGEAPRHNTSTDRLARALGASADLPTPDEFFVELVSSPPLEECRRKLTKEVRQLMDQMIAGFSQEEMEARKKGDSKLAEVVSRKIGQFHDARDKMLGYIDSEEFADRFAERWAKAVSEAAKGYTSGGVASTPVPRPSGASFLDGLFPDDPREFQEVIEKFVDEEIKVSIQKAARKGGRPRERDRLWELTQKMEEDDPNVTDERIANEHNKRFSKGIKDRKWDKATAKTVADVRYDRTGRKRGQNHE